MGAFSLRPTDDLGSIGRMKGRTTRVAFIALNLDISDPTFAEDRQSIKLAIPSISGYIFEAGYDQIRQYDFEVEPFRLEREQPGSFVFDPFFDDSRVDPAIRSRSCPSGQRGTAQERGGAAHGSEWSMAEMEQVVSGRKRKSTRPG